MRALGSLILAVVVGIVLIWLFVELLIGVFKLIGVLIAIGLAVAVYFIAERAIGRGRRL